MSIFAKWVGFLRSSANPIPDRVPDPKEPVKLTFVPGNRITNAVGLHDEGVYLTDTSGKDYVVTIVVRDSKPQLELTERTST